jgi:hypothetical protein
MCRLNGQRDELLHQGTKCERDEKCHWPGNHPSIQPAADQAGRQARVDHGDDERHQQAHDQAHPKGEGERRVSGGQAHAYTRSKDGVRLPISPR